MRTNLAFVLLGLLAACGDDTHKILPDGPEAIDGALPIDGNGNVDAPATPVTLTVTLDGSASEGVHVYFLNADSSVVSAATTGADGTASAVMDAGGSVTAIEPQPAGARFGTTFTFDTLDTFAGVKPGDNLHLDLGGVASPVPVTITFNLTIPTDLTAGATNYNLATSCGSQDITPVVVTAKTTKQTPIYGSTTKHANGGVANNPPIAVTLSDCNGTADMLITSTDINGTLLSSIYLPGQAVADATDLVVTAAYVPPVSTEATFTNLGTTTTGFFVDKELLTTNGTNLSENSIFTDVTDGSGSGTGSGSSSLPFPVTTGLEQVVFDEIDNDGSVFDFQQALDWSPQSDTYAYDGTRILPHYTAMPAFDPATHEVTWTLGTETGTTDVTFTGVDFDRVTAGSGSGSGSLGSEHQWDWHIVGPGATAGAVKYPTLPTDVFDYNANDTDTISLFDVETATIPGGFDAFRAHAYTGFESIIIGHASGSGQLATANLGVKLTAKGKHVRAHHTRKLSNGRTVLSVQPVRTPPRRH